jgi:hypothetical protein
VLAAQGIGGARSGRASGETPAKPGFLRSKKCAQINTVLKSLLYLLILCKQKLCIWYEIAHNLSGFVALSNMSLFQNFFDFIITP